MTPEETEAQTDVAMPPADTLRARPKALLAPSAEPEVTIETPEKQHRKGYRMHSDEEYLQAIEGSYGMVPIICKRLAVSRQALNDRCKKEPEIAAALKAARMEMVDLGESVMLRNLKLAYAAQEPIINEDGTKTIPFPIDARDARWVLARLGKDRGWGDTTEIIGNNYGASDTVIWTPEQWKARQEAKQRETSEAELLLAEPVDYTP